MREESQGTHSPRKGLLLTQQFSVCAFVNQRYRKCFTFPIRSVIPVPELVLVIACFLRAIWDK